MGEADRPPGMDGSVEFLGKGITEDGSETAEGPRKRAETVAVFEQEAPTVDFGCHHAVVDGETYFFREIVENPDVVVSFEPDYLYARVGETCKRTEKTGEATRDDRAVFPPVVEYVAKKEEPFAVRGDGFKEVDHALFVCAVVGYIGCSEVQVTDEVGFCREWHGRVAFCLVNQCRGRHLWGGDA